MKIAAGVALLVGLAGAAIAVGFAPTPSKNTTPAKGSLANGK
jgi:hypothetical protein